MNKPEFEGKYCVLFCPLRDDDYTWCYAYSERLEAGELSTVFKRCPKCIEEFGE